MECQICCEPFDLDARAPRLLPCGHTFCTECLRGLAAGGRSIKCPDDRKDTPLPKDGVNGLQRNFALQQILSAMPPKASAAAPAPRRVAPPVPPPPAAIASAKKKSEPEVDKATIAEAERLGVPVKVFLLLQEYFSLGINVVCLADDSGSMNVNVNDETLRSRWDELKETYELFCNIVGHFDDDGFELRFLNRPPSMNVKTAEQVRHRFSREPQGSTNLIDALEAIYDSPTCHPRFTHKKLLVIVMTDGLPDGNISRRGRRQGDLHGVMQLITDMHSERGFEDQLFCSFVMCTEDDDVVAQYNEYDDRIPNFDVVDDYESERREILQHRGQDFPFDRSEYVAKIVLGSMDPYYDSLDEDTSFFKEASVAADQNAERRSSVAHGQGPPPVSRTASHTQAHGSPRQPTRVAPPPPARSGSVKSTASKHKHDQDCCVQ